jgi:hypothetical protein
MTEYPLTGGCNCGAVRFEMTELVGAGYCHCTRCQRRTGSAASVSAFIADGALHFTAGEDKLKSWSPPGEGSDKWFCGECGSAIYAHNPNHPNSTAVRMGVFDSDPGVRPSDRQFVKYAAVWEAIPDDGLPRFPESRHSGNAL